MREYSVKKGAHGPVGLRCAKSKALTNAHVADGGRIWLKEEHAETFEKLYPGLLTPVVAEAEVVADVEDEIVPVEDTEPESEPKPTKAEPKKAPAKRVTRKRRSRKATAKKA